MLTVAWLRRQKFEAQLQAVEIVNALAQAMNGGEHTAERTTGNDAVMQQLGVTF